MNFFGVKILDNPDNVAHEHIINTLDSFELELTVPMGCGESKPIKLQFSHELKREGENSPWI